MQTEFYIRWALAELRNVVISPTNCQQAFFFRTQHLSNF